MALRIYILPFLLLACLTLTSCLEVAKEISNWTETQDLETIDGKYHYLAEDGVKIYLPSSFKRYNSIEYLALLDSLVNNEDALKAEKARFKNLRQMKGNHYVFFDNSVNATLAMNCMPYLPLTRQDAQYLLGLFRQNYERLSEETKDTYTKITAKYNDNGKAQVFKAVFKIDNTTINQSFFQHLFFISSNQKTIMLNLTTPFEVNFDPFIQKLKL